MQRALLLLETVAQIGPGATARAIAERAGLPPATAYRLLNLLVGDGYLVRVDDLAGFALGRRARELATGAAAPTLPQVHAVAEDLREEIRHGVHIVALKGARPQWVDRDPDHESPSDEVMLQAWHASAAGKIMLAARADLLTGGQLTRCTPYTIVEWPRLLEELGMVRRCGIAFDREESVVGRVGLAVAVGPSGGPVTGCVFVTGRAGRLDPDAPDVVEPVLAAARRLTGWSGAEQSVS